jgi:hypothetical protein
MNFRNYRLITSVLCALPLYPAQPQPTQKPADTYTFGYEEITIEGRADYAYVLKGTEGVSKGTNIAYTRDLDKLLSQYDLSAKQVADIARDQEAHIKMLNAAYKDNKAALDQLLPASQWLINYVHSVHIERDGLIAERERMIAECAQKMAQIDQCVTRLAQKLQIYKHHKLVENTLWMLDMGIACAVGYYWSQWAGEMV